MPPQQVQRAFPQSVAVESPRSSTPAVARRTTAALNPSPKPRVIRARSVPVQTRDVATQAMLDDPPQIVVREVYPSSVVVTSGRS